MTDKLFDGHEFDEPEFNDNACNETDFEDIAARIRDAFDAVEPSPEAQERMLATLLAAQAEQEAAAQDVAHDIAAQNATGTTPEPPAAFTAIRGGAEVPTDAAVQEPAGKRRNPARIIVPVAACLALVLVLVAGAGIMGTVGLFSSLAPNSTPVASTPSQNTSNAKSAADVATEQSDAYAPAGAMMSATEEGGAYDPGFIDDFNTEEYGLVEETGFVSTKANPLSTVSADVDTASYCNVRRLLSQGQGDIPTGAVRIEEMLNYFDYEYETPTGTQDFATTVQIAPCPWNDQTQLLVLGFATAPEQRAELAGSNLVFLIDVSGSMSSKDKLPLLQDAFAVLTNQLGENDRVSIVTYSGNEEVVLEGASGTDARSIQRAIDRLRASGSTNGEAGLKMAYEVAERNFIKGGVNRIIMASDGDLNVGMTSESDLHDFVSKKRESGIYLSVLGFGSGNYKDTKMETLADYGNGQYHYIDCVDEAERVFEEKLLANLVPFADDVKVQVEFNPAQVKGYRLIGYENRRLADEDFRNDAVDAGDVGPDSQFTVAYEVVLANSSQEVNEPDLKYGTGTGSNGDQAWWQNVNANDLLTCTLRWHAFADDATHETQTVVRTDDITNAPVSDWMRAAAVIEFGMGLRGSDDAGTATFDTVLDLLSKAQMASNGQHDAQWTDFARLVERADALDAGNTKATLVD